VLILLAAASATLPGGAVAEQASQPTSPVAGHIATGDFHTCAVIPALNSAVRCWGFGGNGQLGYGNTDSIGDDEEPARAGPVDLGAGRVAKAVSNGNVHTCALLDDGAVRCWGFGRNGRLGYGNTDTIGDDEAPASAGPVDLGRPAKAISAGSGHTCAVLDDDTVRCWGFGLDGRLGYGDTEDIGDDDDETPGSAGPVNLGEGRTAKAISAGGSHTCALLDNDTIRCWGFAGNGRLGYGNTNDIGRTAATTPDTVGPVKLGEGRTAKAISAGLGHTCAVLDNGAVRCWGAGGSGRLGYGNTDSIGDNETPDMVEPVKIGEGRAAKAITAGAEHTCAVLDNDTVRCWGFGAFGQLGYGNGDAIGDNEDPGAVGPVELGPRRTAAAISAGDLHTCAVLDDTSVRCWGAGANGRLGYCEETIIGDDESPGAVGPVDLGVPGMAADGCPASPPPPDQPAPPQSVPPASSAPSAPSAPPVPSASPEPLPPPGPPLTEPQRQTEVDSFGGWAAWSAFEEGVGYRLVLRGPGGNIAPASVEPRSVPFDVDLGPSEDDGVVAAYSRCEQEPDSYGAGGVLLRTTGRGCDIFRLDVLGGGETKLEGASTDQSSEYLPSIWRDSVAFARVFEQREGRRGDLPYLYVRPLEGGTSERQPGGSRGDDGLPGPTGLDLYGRRMSFTWEWRDGDRLRSELRLDTVGGDNELIKRLGSQGAPANIVTPTGDRGRIYAGAVRLFEDRHEDRLLRLRISTNEFSEAPLQGPPLVGVGAYEGNFLLATADDPRQAPECGPGGCLISPLDISD
jgi:alpha-tubulin suppressor-like RCC1 family protein